MPGREPIFADMTPTSHSDAEEEAMSQPSLFSEYPAVPIRSRVVQSGLQAARLERSRAAFALVQRLRTLMAQPFRRRQTFAVPPRGIRIAVCNDC